MNSKPQGQTVKTNCRNCVFAEYDGITQVGCSAGRIEKFKSMDLVTEARDEDKEFFLVNRLCNFFRTEDWESEGDKLQQVRADCRPSFAVMIYDLKPTENNTVLQTLDSLLKSSALDMYKVRIVVSMYHSDVEDTTQVISRINQLNEKDVHAKLVVNHPGLEREGVDFAAFKHVAECNYAIKLNNDSTFNDNVFPDVNKSLNHDLAQTVFFDYGTGMSVIPLSIIKQQYLHYKNYDNLEADLRVAAIAQGSLHIMEE